MKDVGYVHLVGAGPGDPELLTRKAHRLLGEADAVVYDRLVSDAVVDLIPTGTARIFVGKVPGRHHMPQDDINALLVNLARAGRTVVRLKGGDPFVFGRGSEEALHLARHAVPFTVVPGITSAAGIGAGVGIPLTHREMATGVRFVTGHCRDDRPLEMDWASMADPDTTLVVYMGLANLDRIVAELVTAGLPADTPAAAVQRGTAPGQRQCATTLGRLPSVLEDLGFEAPVLIIIGRVASLAGRLDWCGLAWETPHADQDKREHHG